MKLSKFNNSWFNPGGNAIKRLLWYYINILFFVNPLNPFIGLKIFLLRLFGAKVGAGVCIKPNVNIKYPWNLEIGNFVWIGENVWIDNLGKVIIADNVCISQGAMLLCGNHDYKRDTFDLIVKEIIIEDSCWVGAKSIVCPGVIMHCGSILSVGSVANSNLESNSIYKGNPAIKVRDRIIID